jgi:hypothetical protein
VSQVQAVTVYHAALLEASEPCAAGDDAAAQDEEVFVAQLLRRARLLDSGLHAAVRHVVAAFERARAEAAGPAQSSASAPGADSAGQQDPQDESAPGPRAGSDPGAPAPASLFSEVGPSASAGGGPLGPDGRRRSRAGGERKGSSPFVAREAGGGMLRRGSSGSSRSGSSVLSSWLFGADGDGGNAKGRRRSSAAAPSGIAAALGLGGTSCEDLGQADLMAGKAKRAGIVKTSGLSSDMAFLGGGGGGGPGALDSRLEVEWAPVKTAARMREKLAEYAAEGAAWPRAACILDPVRGSVLCPGPARMLEVLAWLEGRQAETGLRVVRVFTTPRYIP